MITNNMFAITGRTTSDIRVYTNSDGSRKIIFTVAVRNAYKDKGGNHGAQFIGVEAFIPAHQPDLGVYSCIRQGDLVAVGGSIRSSHYTGKDGKPVYTQALVIDNVTLLESRQVSENRARQRTSFT